MTVHQTLSNAYYTTQMSNVENAVTGAARMVLTGACVGAGILLLFVGWALIDVYVIPCWREVFLPWWWKRRSRRR